jgi:hypothetical protein
MTRMSIREVWCVNFGGFLMLAVVSTIEARHPLFALICWAMAVASVCAYREAR